MFSAVLKVFWSRSKSFWIIFSGLVVATFRICCSEASVCWKLYQRYRSTTVWTQNFSILFNLIDVHGERPVVHAFDCATEMPLLLLCDRSFLDRKSAFFQSIKFFLLCLAWLLHLSLLTWPRYRWVFCRWERSTSISQKKCHMASKWSLTMSLSFVAGSLRLVWCTHFCLVGLVFTGFGSMTEKVGLCFSFFHGRSCRPCFPFLMPCACESCALDTTTSLQSSFMTISSSWALIEFNGLYLLHAAVQAG